METMLVPQARLFAYQDGFMIVAVMFVFAPGAGTDDARRRRLEAA